MYPGGSFYQVKQFSTQFIGIVPKNIILMIGDGMTTNGNHLFLENFKHVGFSKTQSASNCVTDSAAGGIALFTGVKTYNGAIGVDIDTLPLKNISEMAEVKKMAIGSVHIFNYACYIGFFCCSSTIQNNV